MELLATKRSKDYSCVSCKPCCSSWNFDIWRSHDWCLNFWRLTHNWCIASFSLLGNLIWIKCCVHTFIMLSFFNVSIVASSWQSVACELIPLILFHVVLDIDNTHVILVHYEFSLVHIWSYIFFSLDILWLSKYSWLTAFNFLCCAFNNLLSHSLFHQIDFTLSYQFHVCVCKWYEQLVAVAFK